MAKETFASRRGFIMASVGAAVGLGNAMRFPGLCAKYGGGAFLIIYVLALAVLGVPLLNAEIAAGRKFKGGAPVCFRGLSKKSEAVGWAACVNSAITAVVYAGLAAWILSEALSMGSVCALPREKAGEYFFSEILKSGRDGVVRGISPLVLLSSAAVWAVMLFCLSGGAKRLSAAAKFTVIIPMIFLVALAARGLFYDNSAAALSALFMPDFSALSSPEIWINALGQVFFSLSLAVGIMPAYGSYLPEKTNVFTSSVIIASADAVVSIIASVALFTTLYGCGLQSSVGDSGMITAFSVYPSAISSLFGRGSPLNAAAGTAFYLSLAMMAVQSGVSMLEALASPLAGKFASRKKIAAVMCAAGFAAGAVYCTTAGDVVMEISDIFVNFYNVILLALAECLLFGRRKNARVLVPEINRYTKRAKMPPAFFGISIGVFCPVILATLGASEIFKLALGGTGYPPWAETAFGWGLSAAVLAAGFLFRRASDRIR